MIFSKRSTSVYWFLTQYPQRSQFHILCSCQSDGWKLSNHRNGARKFDKQRLRVPSSSQPASHLFSLQTLYLNTQDSLVSLKCYRSVSHMQRVSVSGMNYTAWDLFIRRVAVFRIVHASLQQRNDVTSSFWASDNSSSVSGRISPPQVQPFRVCACMCVCVYVNLWRHAQMFAFSWRFTVHCVRLPQGPEHASFLVLIPLPMKSQL